MCIRVHVMGATGSAPECLSPLSVSQDPNRLGKHGKGNIGDILLLYWRDFAVALFSRHKIVKKSLGFGARNCI